MKTFKLIIFFTLFGITLTAQEVKPPTLPIPQPTIDSSTQLSTTSLVDSTLLKKDKKKKKFKGFFKDDYPNPKKAMLLSFAIPGAGQAYNKKFWKIPLAMGGTVSMIFLVRNNTRNYRFLRDEYAARVDDDPGTMPDPGLVNWADEDIRAERNRWNKWKEMSYIGLGLIQALGGVDAFVDAHFKGYEINENLTMKLKPSLESSTAFGPVIGFGISLQLNVPRELEPRPFLAD